MHVTGGDSLESADLGGVGRLTGDDRRPEEVGVV